MAQSSSDEFFWHIFVGRQGHATSSVLATLGDYFDDFSRLIEQSWFKRCAH
jgi:hypothetical protein